jgi:scyllo-inositol 2-dehydrogenase (NADP+)
MSETFINYAIVGYGSAGRTIHLPLIAHEPRLKLRGIMARKAETREQAKAAHGCLTYSTIEEMLGDEELDLVIITTPHDSHAPIAIQSLDAGKNVVTDKPMCLSMSEYDAMVEAQKRSGKLLTVFHNARESGDFRTLRSVMESGQLGEMRWLELNWNRHGLSQRSKWRNEASANGGRLIDLGVHLIDQALLVFPQRIMSVYTRMNKDWPDADVESACMITIAFDGGGTAIIDVGSMTRYAKPKYIAVGTQATWTKPPNIYDPQDAAVSSSDYTKNIEPEMGYGTLIAEIATNQTHTISGDWRTFYYNLADVLLEGAKPLVQLDEMRRVILVMTAALESARTGDVVRL